MKNSGTILLEKLQSTNLKSSKSLSGKNCFQYASQLGDVCAYFYSKERIIHHQSVEEKLKPFPYPSCKSITSLKDHLGTSPSKIFQIISENHSDFPFEGDFIPSMICFLIYARTLSTLKNEHYKDLLNGDDFAAQIDTHFAKLVYQFEERNSNLQGPLFAEGMETTVKLLTLEESNKRPQKRFFELILTEYENSLNSSKKRKKL